MSFKLTTHIHIFEKKIVKILNENISYDLISFNVLRYCCRLSMRMKCKGRKKIHPLATTGSSVALSKVRRRRRSASICVDGLSALSPDLCLFLPKEVCRVIYLNKPLDKKSTHDPSSTP